MVAKGLYDEEPTGVWTNQVADHDGTTCVWCRQKIPRHHPIAVAEDGRIMHRECFEDQPTQIRSPDDNSEFD